MKAQQRLDRILEPIAERVKSEVGSLMGVNFEVSSSKNELLTKEDCFLQLPGKQVVAKMDITGEVEGVGCLLIGVKDAIRLGGTLIMLPPTELEEVIRNEDYNEETEDSYGEIANIIAGSYTKVFEEMYPDNCRYVRKEQELIVPMKVDIDSEEPVPNQIYYRASVGMTLDGVEMGDLVMLIPAEAFGIDTSAMQVTTESTETTSSSEAESQSETAVEDNSTEESGTEKFSDSTDTAEVEKEAVAEADVSQESLVNLEKQRERIDGILEACRKRMSEEVGVLLGVDVKITDLVNRPIKKEEFFLDETVGKQVLSYMDIIDEKKDKSYLFVSLKDAIRIGGILIMLPPSEIEIAVSEEDFSVDAEDAYGEIANIISGVYTSVFQEQFSSDIRFVKTELEEITPLKVSMESDKPFPDQLYYLSSGQLTIDSKEMGNVQMLFPAPMLGLDGLGVALPEEESATNEEKSSVVAPTDTKEDIGAEGVGAAKGLREDTDILIIGDDEVEIAKMLKYLNSVGNTAAALSLKDNPANYITNNIKVVFLVMKEVNEQSFGLVIKVSAVCTVPLVAAGPGWTRTKVINAVKYGVNDILLTPATDPDIQEKVEGNMVKLAA